MIPMKQLILMLAVVTLVGCGQSKESSGPSVTPKATSEKETRDPEPSVTPKAELKKPLTKEESARHSKVIEAEIREAAGKPTGKLTKVDLEKVTKLNLSNKQLTKVPKGLEKLMQLTKLDLSYNELTDVKGLEKLTKLTKLDLGINKLTDVKGLEKLTKLEELDFDFNQLADVKSLMKLTRLTELVLVDNPALTKAQIAELKKALPKCDIYSSHTE